MNDYWISVVTPCHNVNIELLERTFQSLKNQTCGFDKIEWVVIIHNCVAENAAQIERLTGNAENIKVFTLQNNKNYAASPRNYGLERATGEFVTFLDADDYVETDAYETALGYLRETEAQVCVFRYEVLRESPDIKFAIRPLVYMDQTRKVIVGNRKTLDGAKYIHGEAFQIGSKVYSRSLLERYRIRFDESIPYAEESDFFLRCYGNAEKLCFLPQYIGQTYCMFSDGMTAMLKKTPEVAVNYARGFKKLFDNGLEMELYMNTFMWDLLGFYSAVLLASMEMTLKHRLEVKRLLLPYFKMLKPLEPSKIYTASKIKLIKNLVGLVLLRPRLISAAMALLRALKVDIAERIVIQYETEYRE
jgi:glycosyltransferase involved in cell wall biosynthesis